MEKCLKDVFESENFQHLVLCDALCLCDPQTFERKRCMDLETAEIICVDSMVNKNKTYLLNYLLLRAISTNFIFVILKAICSNSIATYNYVKMQSNLSFTFCPNPCIVIKIKSVFMNYLFFDHIFKTLPPKQRCKNAEYLVIFYPKP